MIGFLVVAIGLLVLIHYYLWRKLVRATTRPGRWRRAGTGAIVAAGLCLVAALVGSRILPHHVATALAWPGYLWLAVLFYLLLALLLLELPVLVLRRWLDRGAATPEAAEAPDATRAAGAPGAAAAHDATNQSRRLLLARSVAGLAGVAALGVTGSGISTALGPPNLRRIQIPLPKLPRGSDGLRIALVSDIHLGPLRGRSATVRIVDMVNGLDVDLVAIVGDLVDGSVAELGTAAEPLRNLRSRYGSFFVTGNHEYFSGFRQWVAEVASFGVRPLRNERLEVAGLTLAGVNDATGAGYGDPADYDKALKGRDPRLATILLAHQPVQAHEAARRGVDLQLSGHTHGGQLAPFNLVVALQQPVVSGLGRVDGMPVYVTNGAGFWGPPVRVGAPPDITLVELRSKA
jgi:predicted MPP superfamily phosphohydrolase